MPLNEQELNRKLAEWAGMTRLVEYYKSSSIPPNDANFTQSLDACFKWLVPKLVDVRIKLNEAPSGDAFWNVEVSYYGARTSNTSETPALALCLAVEKLIDMESTDALH